MGKGGSLQVHAVAASPLLQTSTGQPLTTRQPTEKPSFTIGTLRKAIPEHCFERNTLTSFAYLAKDLAVVAALFYASTLIPLAGVWAWALWPAYWFFQGAFMTGVWVIAHECGHQAFSKSQAVNDGVGLVLHSLLLVPYYSWKHSHRRHHSNTGSVAKDEVFVPKPREMAAPEEDTLFGIPSSWAPLRLTVIAFTLTLGWPLYLVANVSGRSYPRWANHFSPYSPIYSKRERAEILVSDIALLAVGAGLACLGNAVGWATLAKTYIIPYLVVNFWLVMITLLQHTHPNMPHYTDDEWDWLRGALATVDRSFGFLDKIHHHIADTHVAHHLFSQMPHYHAQEATEAIKPVLGPYYMKDDRNVFKALWEDHAVCHYVAPDTPGAGVLWYRR